MKVCFITENLAAVGGVQRVLSVVANALCGEHEVSILMTSPLSVSDKVSFHLEEQITVIREEPLSGGKTKYLFPYKALRYINKKLIKINNISLMKWAYFPPKEVVAFNEFFKRNPVDVVIGVQPRAAALVSTLTGSFKKIGWMHSPYDAYFRSPMRFQWRQENLYKEMLPKLDKIVVLTDHDKKQFVNELSIGGGQSVVRIYNPLSFISNEKVNLKNSSKSAKLLFVGRLVWEQKGLGLLLEILSHLKRMKLQFTLNIVGDGPDKERFLIEAAKVGVDDNVIMCGMQSDVVPYYLQCDILLLPSKWEGFGLVATEAMECGLPVISFRTEGPEEILSGQLAECLIDKYDTEAFAEKVLSLIQKRQELQRISELAEIRAKVFSVQSIIPQWNKLICG